MDNTWKGINALYLCGLLMAAALMAAPVVSLAQTETASMDTVVPVTTSAAPVANAGPDQTVNEDVLVTFDGSGSSDDVAVTNYWWNFTDATPQSLTGVGPTYTFATPGVYNVTLTVGDAEALRDTDYVVITVKDVTNPVANAGADQTVVVFAPVTFNGSASTDNGVIAGYWWNFTDGAAKTLTGVQPTYAFANASTYTVTLEVVDGNANKHTDTVDIVVGADTTAPDVVVANMNVDEDAVVTFDSTSCTDDGAILFYWWNNTAGGAPTLTGPAPTYTFANPGAYSINLTVRDGGLNRNWTTFTVTVADVTDPVAVAGADIVTDEDVPVFFNATLSGDNVGIVAYTWDFTDVTAQQLTGALPNYTFATPGSYNVTLTAEDAAGNTGTDMLVVTVEDATGPTGTLVAAPASPQDQGTLVDFTATMTDNVTPVAYLTYEFFVDGTAVASVNNTMSYNFTAAGTFTVRVEATDNATNVGFVEIAYVVNDITVPTVVVSGTPASPVDMGGWVNFTATASDNLSDVANITYQWYLDDVAVVNATKAWFNHTFAVPGAYVVSVEIEDEAGNAAADNVTYVIVDTVDPVADAGANQTIDAGSQITFDGSGSSDNVGIVTYTWAWPIVSTATGVSPTVTFTLAPGVYNVTLTVADADGNTATDVMTVTVVDLSAPVADAGADQSVPQGTAVDFDASASADNVAITNYTWTFNDGTDDVTLYGVAVNYTFADIGVYAVTLNVTDAAGHYDVDTLDVNVTDGIAPTAAAGADVTGYLAPDYTMSFDASDSSDNVMIANYTWTFVDGTKVVQVLNATTNATENVTVDNVVTLYGVFASYDFDTVGAYAVTLTVADAAGNDDTDTLTVTVAADTTAPISNVNAIPTYWSATAGISIVVTATDAQSGVASVALYVATSTDDATYGAYAMVGAADTAAPYAWTYTAAADGYFRFYSIATDVAGNVETAPAAADATAGYDATDPTATIAADLEAVEEGATVTFTVTTADNLGTPTVTVVITDADGATVDTLTGAAPTYVFDTAGTYTVTVTATDAAGNTATDAATITVSAPEEEEGSLLWLWILIVVIILVIVVVVVVVLLMGKKGDGAAPEGEQPASEEPKKE